VGRVVAIGKGRRENTNPFTLRLEANQGKGESFFVGARLSKCQGEHRKNFDSFEWARWIIPSQEQFAFPSAPAHHAISMAAPGRGSRIRGCRRPQARRENSNADVALCAVHSQGRDISKLPKQPKNKGKRSWSGELCCG